MINIYRYRLPFRAPFSTASHRFTQREGAIIRYHDSNIEIVSEAAPLPGFSTETLPEVLQVLSRHCNEFDRFFGKPYSLKALGKWLKEQPQYPSIQFALSSLGVSILCERLGCTLPELFSAGTRQTILMNGVIGTLPEEPFIAKAEELYRDGFSTLKCKVTGSTGHLPTSLATLHRSHPNILFRLDANRSWPRPKVAEFSARFNNLPVEYIEEPTECSSPACFAKLSHECNIPVAADESITEFGLQAILEQPEHPHTIVVKPGLTGNLLELFATLHPRDHLDVKVVITTALESAVATRMIAAIAALLGHPASAHGLNTGILFRENLAEENRITGGTFSFGNKMTAWFTFSELNQHALFPYPDG